MFQALWAPIDAAAEGKDPEVIAKKNGFARATWFEYRNKGTIPFHLLERVAAYLKVRLSVSVDGLSGVSVTTEAAHQEGTPLDYGKKLAQLIEEVPPDQQAAAFGAAFTAAQAAIRDLPFDEPAADAKASRSRGSKK